MSLAWGNHTNGLIPSSQLEGIGYGALPGGMQYGKMQYVHPTVARAWRALVKRVAEQTGTKLRVSEGYRDRNLQQYYWDTLPYPQAAWPGTSSHGWARAIDMYGYTVSDLQAVRGIGPSLGWSLATGDRVGEPWHIEYTASLTSPPDFAGDDETTPLPNPIPPPIPKAEPDMIVFLQVSGQSPVYVLGGGFDYQFASADELTSFRNVLGNSGYTVPNVVTIPSTFVLNLYRRALVPSPSLAQIGQTVDQVLDAQPAPPASSADASFTATDRARLNAIPTASENAKATRAAIIKE